MLHLIERVEPRHLLAVVSGDPSFGTSGSVALAPGFGTAVLATHGAVYVERFNAARGHVYLSKYSDAGLLDTAWGDGGSVRPTISRNLYPKNATPPAAGTDAEAGQLVYDVRTGGLLLATDGSRSLTIERFTANGHDDATWGNDGVAQYTAPKGSTLSLGKMLPTGGKRLSVAFTRGEIYSTSGIKESESGVTYPDGTDSSGTSVLLMRFDRLGRTDKTFNTGRPVLLRAGHQRTVTTTSGAEGSIFREDFDTNAPTFGDLRAIDTGYRIVTTREQTVAAYTSSDQTDTSSVSGRTKWLAEAYDVSAGGAVAATESAVIYRNAYGFSGAAAGDVHTFQPLATIATDGQGTAVLARSDTAAGPTYRVLRVSAGRLVSDTAAGGDLGDGYLYSRDVSRNADGIVFVLAPPRQNRVVRFKPDFSVDSVFGSGGAASGLTSGTGNLEDLLITPDDAGRLISVDRTPGGALTLRRLV